MIKFYYYTQILFDWIAWKFSIVAEWALEKREALCFEYWQSHPEEMTKLEDAIREIADEMNFGPDND